MDILTLREKHLDHWKKATAIRIMALDAVKAANSGHSGMPMGMADVATILFEKHLKFDPLNPDWPDRDRFILSAGHGSMLLYALLHLTGYEDMTMDQIQNFRQLGAITAGHPEYGHAKGIETTTGPLGQGIANAVGFAMAEEHLRAVHGHTVMDHYTYVIAGDGCLMEGISQEAIAFAGHQKLSKLIVLWDNNGITIDGSVSIADSTDQKARFAASGWDVFECDGHDPEDIDRAITQARMSENPAMIACKTHIALGSSAQDTSKGHGALTDDTLIAQTRETYGWEYSPFEIPQDIQTAWKLIGKRGHDTYQRWKKTLADLPDNKRNNFERAFRNEIPAQLQKVLKAHKQDLIEKQTKTATRAASEQALGVINPVMPETLGGSADLTGSNNTKTKDMGVFSPENRKGRYVHYGIREHGMAAMMNGMALHGGIRPYGGTFMCFTDYARPAMRLSALMGVPVIYVMTHDSIGLGEDGPTHQPVEHLAISRATPNTLVFRPADAVETAESWEIALRQTQTPSVLSLTRQSVPLLQDKFYNKNRAEQGAYILSDAQHPLSVVLIATGSEVSLAIEAQRVLEKEAIGVRVVSMPCMELFAQQDLGYQKKVLSKKTVRIGIEAGLQAAGWDRWLFGDGAKTGKSAFIGMEGFGASAPADALYSHFGITVEAIVDKARDLLAK